MSEKSFNFEFSADKGRLEKVFDSIFAATKFSSKEPIIVINDGILEGFDLSVKALIPYVRCNQSFFIGEVTGRGYFCLTKTLLEKFSKGFAAGTVTISGKITLRPVAGRGVETTGEIIIVGEGTEYVEPISLPEFPDKVQSTNTQLDYFPTFGATIDRDENYLVPKLKLDMVVSGVMSIQEIAAMPPSKTATIIFGPDSVNASIKDAGKFSKNMSIEYVLTSEENVEFLANNTYFKRATEFLEGKVLVSVYGVLKAEESIIAFTQKTEDLEYIFFVSGKN